MPGAPIFHRQSISTATGWIDRLAPRLDVESVPLNDAVGRCLACDIHAQHTCPSNTIAALDGYALAAAGTVGASDYSPLPFRQTDAATPLQPAEAVPLANGEALPDNADAVIEQEQVEQRARTLEVSATVAPGSGVIAAGEEFETGALLLSAGRRLRPQDIAWLALDRRDKVDVIGRPRITVLLVGGVPHDANGPALTAAIARDGGRVVHAARVDSAAALKNALASIDSDAVITAGGTGQGVNDFAIATLAKFGRIDIYGVAMNPGESTALGFAAERPVLALPGRPLACLCAYDRLGSYLVRHLAGDASGASHDTRQMPLKRKVVSSIGQTDICRVRIDAAGAEPLATAENRLLSTLVAADGYILIPENSEGHPAETMVTVHLY